MEGSRYPGGTKLFLKAKHWKDSQVEDSQGNVRYWVTRVPGKFFGEALVIRDVDRTPVFQVARKGLSCTWEVYTDCSDKPNPATKLFSMEAGFFCSGFKVYSHQGGNTRTKTHVAKATNWLATKYIVRTHAEGTAKQAGTTEVAVLKCKTSWQSTHFDMDATKDAHPALLVALAYAINRQQLQWDSAGGGGGD